MRIKHRNGVECVHGRFLHEPCNDCEPEKDLLETIKSLQFEIDMLSPVELQKNKWAEMCKRAWIDRDAYRVRAEASEALLKSLMSEP